MLRNESLAVGVNVDVAVRLFIVPFMRGVRAPATADELCESDLTSNTTCRCLMVTWLSRSSFNHQFKKKICYRCTNQKSKFCFSARDKGKYFFVLLLACVLRNLSDTWSFKVPRRRLYAIIRHPRGQSDVARQWTLVFVSSKIPHCSRSWSVVLLFIVST